MSRERLALWRQTMKNIILIGFMGAGKTTIGEAFARRRNMRLIDTDQMIEETAGMTISDIFALKGEGEFRKTETAVLKRLMEEEEGVVLSVGGGLPLREENRRLLKKLGVVVYLEVSPETVVKRLEGDTTRPLLQGANVREKAEKLLSERGPIYRMASDITVNVDGRSVDGIIEELEERTGEVL